jgi:hypothetical protein
MARRLRKRPPLPRTQEIALLSSRSDNHCLKGLFPMAVAQYTRRPPTDQSGGLIKSVCGGTGVAGSLDEAKAAFRAAGVRAH